MQNDKLNGEKTVNIFKPLFHLLDIGNDEVQSKIGAVRMTKTCFIPQIEFDYLNPNLAFKFHFGKVKMMRL